MKVKKAVVHWLVSGNEHPALTDKDKKIEALMPMVSALFPGINYFSISGFSEAMHKCVVPALKKQFPELQGIPAEKVGAEEEVEISEVLPSKGHQWQESKHWQSRFQKLLLAA